MNAIKIKKILKELFENQTDMAMKLGVSQAKISEVIRGKQHLHVEGIAKLLTEYNIESEWFFNGGDDEAIRFNNKSIDDVYKNKYMDVLEKNMLLSDVLAEYQSKKIDALKNNQSVSSKS